MPINFEEKYPSLIAKPHLGLGVGEGWQPLIDELLCKLQALNVPNLQIIQIKEKFGGLRVYYSDGNKEVHQLVEQYEKKASKTCEQCGKPGKLDTENWLKTRCDSCREKWAARS